MSQVERILDIYDRLLRGEVVNRAEAAAYYCTDRRTISRDIQAIASILGKTPDFSISHDRRRGGYCLPREDVFWLSREEVLTIVKILLESRSLNREEIEVITKLARLCNPEQQKIVEEAVRCEQHHYQPVSHGKHLFPLVWELNSAIREKRVVELDYQRAASGGKVNRRVEPLAILFSEYYFYLIANIHQANYPEPAVFRLDRIKNFQITNTRFRPVYGRFNEGEFRKRVQFMQKGRLIKLTIKVQEPALEATLDRLPTAELIDQTNSIITAEVYGDGIMMWLLSQGDLVEVLAPDEFRVKMKNTIQGMLNLY